MSAAMIEDAILTYKRQKLRELNDPCNPAAWTSRQDAEANQLGAEIEEAEAVQAEAWAEKVPASPEVRKHARIKRQNAEEARRDLAESNAPWAVNWRRHRADASVAGSVTTSAPIRPQTAARESRASSSRSRGSKRGASRSSGRGGDSGDSDSDGSGGAGHQTEALERACLHCSASIEHHAPQARFCHDAHRKAFARSEAKIARAAEDAEVIGWRVSREDIALEETFDEMERSMVCDGDDQPLRLVAKKRRRSERRVLA